MDREEVECPVSYEKIRNGYAMLSQTYCGFLTSTEEIQEIYNAK